ncbi:hypothetical protein [Bacillus chungangensis]|uniref:Uncharacterized protein n=1 Tax=Bacillus chungangensis TaxID=587633 RepID=A0ABT9WYU0_9BACI|nr:hypothetical protein [Bacillus chungangensis]MDQ0178385.1 hypothetical protein [Bacillus chungangensis]
MELKKDILIEIDGLGIIIYSPHAVSFIQEDEDYLTSKYLTAEQVADHVNNGTIVSFGTGSPGNYLLKIRSGYPNENLLDSFDFVLRLGIQVSGEIIFFRDLYDLMEWTSHCPSTQSIHLENGYYHITVFSNLPKSGIRGENQEIYVYFNKLRCFPKIKYYGVPTFEQLT